MSGIRAAACFTLIQVLSGQVPTTVKPENLATIHTISVISKLGDQAEIKSVGVTVFGNRSSYLPITEWRLDDIADQEAEKILSARFTVKVAPFDKVLLSRVHGDAFTDEGTVLMDVVRHLPPIGVDAYLILLPERWDYPTLRYAV